MPSFLQSWFIDLPGQPKKRKPVKAGQDPEMAARRLRGFYSSPNGIKFGRVIVSVIEVSTSADMEKGATLPENFSGWVVFDAAKGYIVAEGLTEEQAVELLKLNEGMDYTRFKVN